MEFQDYDEFLKKYGSPFGESSVATAIGIVYNLYDGAGDLLFRGLVDPESVSNIPNGAIWRKMKPIIEGIRKQYNWPLLYTKFEYLNNEMKNKEKTLQQPKA